ncbi:MAG: GMC family oxidoreductase [Chloroflexi bacterium]|nr:GMC family oxidoreductase [Chloroflexota bacterium]
MLNENSHPMKEQRKKVIIVGGGTAGAIVSKNLSSDFDVTVIDKSVNTRMPLLYRVPLMIGLLFNRDTRYITKSTLRFNSNRDIPFFNSNLIGGASIINGCVHVVGNTNLWKGILLRFGLKFDDFKSSYQSIFTRRMETKKIHLVEAKKGWIDDLFFHALKEKGIDRGDVEWTDATVSGMVFNTVKRHLRSSVMDLNPFERSTIMDNCRIERLVVNEKSKIVGVFDGRKIILGDYIFLCAGVIETNTLLLREALRVDDGVLIALNLDAGQRIKDHTNLRVNVKAKKNIGSLNEIDASTFEKVKMGIKHALGVWTLMRGTGATATANIDLDGDGVVDTRINLLRFYEAGRMGSNGRLFSSHSPGFSISITQINPKSSGGLTITPSKVDVMPNYLSDTSDIKHLEQALNFVMQLLETRPLREIVERIEGAEIIKNSPDKYISEHTYSGYHLIGGCGHLLGENFEVDRYNNLYVCDASAISEYPSSNIHSTVAILADLCSKKFAGQI